MADILQHTALQWTLSTDILAVGNVKMLRSIGGINRNWSAGPVGNIQTMSQVKFMNFIYTWSSLDFMFVPGL